MLVSYANYKRENNCKNIEVLENGMEYVLSQQNIDFKSIISPLEDENNSSHCDSNCRSFKVRCSAWLPSSVRYLSIS